VDGDSTANELTVDEPTGFVDLGIDPLLVAGLSETGIEVPSPIQESAIPVLLSGQNAAMQSYTGSGKVCASRSHNATVFSACICAAVESLVPGTPQQLPGAIQHCMQPAAGLRSTRPMSVAGVHIKGMQSAGAPWSHVC
jgi:hypothetical protein